MLSSRPGPGCSSLRSPRRRQPCSPSSRATLGHRPRGDLGAGASAARGDGDRRLGQRTGSCAAFPARALVLFGPPRSVTARTASIRLAVAARLAASPCYGAGFRGSAVPSGPWRDYVTLTKPRIMSLLLAEGAAGCSSAAGRTAARAVRGDDRRPRARMRRREHAHHLLDARHRPADGHPHASGAPRRGAGCAVAGARVRARVSAPPSSCSRARSTSLTATLALVGNLFYVIVYTRWLNGRRRRTSSSAELPARYRRSSATRPHPETSAGRRSGSS